jgi:hypothetical protein
MILIELTSEFYKKIAHEALTNPNRDINKNCMEVLNNLYT